MITTRLFGGLGNQMFQYATGRALALRLGVDLSLDMRDTTRLGGHNQFQLHRHGIQVVEPENLPPDRKEKPLAYVAWRITSRRLYREKSLGFSPEVLRLPDETYLHGYFQSEKYFADAADTIRSELSLTELLSPETRDWAGRIASDALSVSLHVRRGDYLSAGNFGTCDAAYYNRALATLTDRLGARPNVYAFSDDPDWVRDHLHLEAEMDVVGHNPPERGHEDMALMSTCQNHIIANSTFSWWGAWMNPRADKIVVAPKIWFSNPKQKNPDILPDSWIAV